MFTKGRHFNWVLFGAMVSLIALGTLAIWSAGNARTETLFHGAWKSNLMTAVLGMGLYFALAFLDYRRVIRVAAPCFYGAVIVLLILVLVAGSTVYGGRRWLWFFQPSEIAKLGVIGLVAAIWGEAPSRVSTFNRFGFPGFLLAAAVVGVPLLLILLEPDLGTALTLLPALVVMLLTAGVWRKWLVASLGVMLVVSMAVLGAVYEAEKPGVSAERRAAILAHIPLRPHQVKRVKTFLFPESDRMGAGYNLRQAMIAIGSGGFAGKGLGQGETNHLRYLPPSISMNDFIFCVWAEETGFRGAAALLLLFGTLVVSGGWIAWHATDGRGQLLAIGVSTLIFAHVYVNIAMSVGLVPITGLPLPFISSGRTFLITVMAGLGLVQSVSVHREELT